MSYNYLFGPVPSRRLGVSLGIDITPMKDCTLNCVYCECGKTSGLSLERNEFVPTAEVIGELEDFLSKNPELDAVTFSGSGEPTLHSGLGEIVAFLKSAYPQYRLVVLTNGTLLHRDDVRSELRQCDLVVPSLDAVSEQAFRTINRPAPGLTSEMVIRGLKQFCAEFKGEIWLEIFVVAGINDTPRELQLFRDLLPELGVQKVQLNTLDRPGAVDWVEPMPRQNLEALARELGHGAEVISNPLKRHSVASFDTDVSKRILSTVRVRPCTLEDLSSVFGMHVLDVGKYLDVLLAEGKLEVREEQRGVFYFSRWRG